MYQKFKMLSIYGFLEKLQITYFKLKIPTKKGDFTNIFLLPRRFMAKL
jgi:hypothetical protein